MSESPTGQAISSTSSSGYDVGLIFEDALSVYTQTTGIDLSMNRFASEDRIGEADSPEAILLLLQERAHASEESRNDNQTLTSTLNPAVRVLHALSRNLDEAVGTVRSSPASVIFAGIDTLLATVSRTSNYNDLIKLFGRLSNFLKRLEIYTTIPLSLLMTELIVKIMAESLSVLALATKIYKDGRIKQLIKKWSDERKIVDALQRLDRLTQEDRMAVAQTLGVVHGFVDDVNERMEENSASMDVIQQDLDVLRSEGNNMRHVQLRRDVQRWLSPPNPSTNHNIFWRARHQGTAAWFFENEVFIRWQTTGGLLWIHGNPGSGKSTLLSAIIEGIRERRAAGLASMAYYYFDYHDVEKQDRFGLVSSLLFQLSAESNTYYWALYRLYEDNAGGTGVEKPTYSALIKCLKDMLSLPTQTPIFIIVDALDECPNFSTRHSAREEVLELMEELLDLKLPGLHLCVASRPEIDIRMVLGPLTDLQISLHDASGQKEDMIAYIKAVVHSDRKMKRWKEEDQNLVVEKLSQNADGAFRWVVCQIDALCFSFRHNIRSVLADLPPSLDETYEKALLGIRMENREYALRLYQCLMASKRPLRVEELADIFAIRFDKAVSPMFNAAWRPENPEEAVMSACSSLVAIVDREGSQVVRFSHFSVKEYLTSERLSSAEQRLSYYHILPETAHTILARASLSVLLQLDDKINRNATGDSTLTCYAAQHWVDHVQFKGVSSHVQELMERLFDSALPHFAAWISLYDIDRDRKEPMSETHPTQPGVVPLYYASLCGFDGLVKHLLVSHSQTVNARGGHHVTSLHAALSKGHMKVAQLLLQHGADVKARDDEYMTPLHIAAEYEDTEVIQSLIDHGADINAEDFDQSIPLSLASRKGRRGAAQLLLKHGARVGHRDFFGQTPMHEASHNGHADIVRLLLDRGADANATGGCLRTPLHLAVGQGKLLVSQLLVERGAKLDARDEMGRTPLHFASEHGDPEILSFLIDNGANRDARSKTQETPLFLASRNGKLEAARLLLMCGADINSQDSRGCAPLHVAAENGYPEVVRLLLDRGADPNAQERSLRTPLHLAADRGEFAVSRLLFEHGAKLDAQDEMNRTPLHVASEHGDLEILRFLISQGANPNARSKDQETPLFLASRKGKLEAARLLSEFDSTDINSQDSLERTPLHVAAENGHFNVVHLLLDQGADPHAREKKLRTPLHLAAARGELKVMRLLIARGAKVDPRDETDWTPLHFASEHGDPDTVRFLISRSAKPNARTKDRETPLSLATRKGKLEVARLLSEHGTDFDSRDLPRRTPPRVALAAGNVADLHDLAAPGRDRRERGRGRARAELALLRSVS